MAKAGLAQGDLYRAEEICVGCRCNQRRHLYIQHNIVDYLALVEAKLQRPIPTRPDLPSFGHSRAHRLSATGYLTIGDGDGR